ncbi:transcription factor 24-like [Ornithodoros turicata]|uniref:transcription factor 24-like n=1 Tax=Ornithodoros turicata TaxID=34597 RepID=UPI003139833C
MDDFMSFDLNITDSSWQLWDEFQQDQCLSSVLSLDNDPMLPSPFVPDIHGSPGSSSADSANAATASCGGKRIAAPSRNAARERTRVRSLRSAFQNLQRSLPAVPPDTKLSKLDVLVLASNYIAHLAQLLSENEPPQAPVPAIEEDLLCSPNPSQAATDTMNRSYFHPVKKWPMRSRLYAGSGPSVATDEPQQQRHIAARKNRSSQRAHPYSFKRNSAL